MIEVVTNEMKPYSTVYRCDKGGMVSKREIEWALDDSTKGYELNLAFYEDKEWHLLVGDYAKNVEDTNKITKITVVEFVEGKGKIKDLGGFDIGVYNLYRWLDCSYGNINTHLEEDSYLYKNGKIQAALTPLLAANKNEPRLDFISTFRIRSNHLERVLTWNDGQGYSVQDAKNDYVIRFLRSPYARNERRALFVENKGITSENPVVESFRFGISPVLLPSEDGGLWILGTFGYYVKLDAELNRANAMSFWERLVNSSSSFGSRKAQYDDFLLDFAVVKSLVLPILLFSLPLLWLLLFLLSKTLGKQPQKRVWYLTIGSGIYLSFALVLAYWFWQISINF